RLRRLPARPSQRPDRLRVPGRGMAAQGRRARRARPPAASRRHASLSLDGTPGRADAERPGRLTALLRVILSGSVGLIAGFAAAWVVPWQASVLLAWDTAAAGFGAWIWFAVHGADAAATQTIATREDNSRPVADLVLIAASVASLMGVGFALLQASGESGRERSFPTTVAVARVALSWL